MIETRRLKNVVIFLQTFSFYFIKRGNRYFLKLVFLIKLVFPISPLHRISFTYNFSAYLFRHSIVEWPWIELRPMLFKKWGPYYSRNFEIFSIIMSSCVHSNLLVFLNSVLKTSFQKLIWVLTLTFFYIFW